MAPPIEVPTQSHCVTPSWSSGRSGQRDVGPPGGTRLRVLGPLRQAPPTVSGQMTRKRSHSWRASTSKSRLLRPGPCQAISTGASNPAPFGEVVISRPRHTIALAHAFHAWQQYVAPAGKSAPLSCTPFFGTPPCATPLPPLSCSLVAISAHAAGPSSRARPLAGRMALGFLRSQCRPTARSTSTPNNCCKAPSPARWPARLQHRYLGVPLQTRSTSSTPAASSLTESVPAPPAFGPALGRLLANLQARVIFGTGGRGSLITHPHR